jgi:predicted ATPase
MLDEWFQKNRISNRDFELNDLNIFIGGNGAGI